MIGIKEVYSKEKTYYEEKMNTMLSFEEDKMQIVKNMHRENCSFDFLLPESPESDINNVIIAYAVCKHKFKITDMFEKIITNTFDPYNFENAKMRITNIKE
jgi:hypothetical protein